MFAFAKALEILRASHQIAGLPTSSHQLLWLDWKQPSSRYFETKPVTTIMFDILLSAALSLGLLAYLLFALLKPERF